MAVDFMLTCLKKAHLETCGSNEHADANEGTNVMALSPKVTMGLRELIAASQAHRKRAQGLPHAAAKIKGETAPHVDGCELESIFKLST